MKMKASDLLEIINLPKHLATHIVGAKHNETHHAIVGAMFIFVGSMVWNVPGYFHFNLMADIGVHSLAGYLHTVGFIPVVAHFEKVREQVKDGNENSVKETDQLMDENSNN